MRWRHTLLIGLLCLMLIAGSVGYIGFWYYFEYKTDDLPDVLSLIDYNFHLTTVVRDDEEKIIDKFAIEDRVYISFREIPLVVKNAIISAEDKKFFSRRFIPGIDPMGIIRAAWKNFWARKTIAGGSTITQQVAKKVWLSDEKTLKRKLKEARLAYRMEKYLSKELIFEIYINLIYLGHNRYGLISASKYYFSKTVDELSVDEAAMLAGLIKWPYQFSPVTNMKAAISRRNAILERMKNNGFITSADFEMLKARSVILKMEDIDPKAPYLSSFIMDKLHQLGYEKVVNQGLEIRTSINSGMQNIAEKALQKSLAAYEGRHRKRLVLYNIFSEYELESLDDFQPESWDDNIGIGSVVDGLITSAGSLETIASIGSEKVIINTESFSKIRQDVVDLTKVFEEGDVVTLKIVGVNSNNNFTAEIVQSEVQGAVVVLDIATGGIKALVGGRNFDDSKYNRVMQADRQPGSAFKPFVYGAFFKKYSSKDLDSIVLDTPICFKTGNPKKPRWCPKNYEEKSLPKFMGPIPVKTAIARSRNVAAVHVASEIGIDKVTDLAHELGITNDLPEYLPTAIGAADVKVIDMANAFAAFFREGINMPYWFLKSVSDRHGNTNDFEPKNYKQALDSETANKVLEGMRWVVLAGTARSASKELPFAVAGKTGTTNNFTDAWFIGGTSRYLVAVWIGFDRKAIPLVSRESLAKETGGFTALPVFIEIMKEIYKDRPYDLFPEEIENRTLGIKIQPVQPESPEKFSES